MWLREAEVLALTERRCRKSNCIKVSPDRHASSLSPRLVSYCTLHQCPSRIRAYRLLSLLQCNFDVRTHTSWSTGLAFSVRNWSSRLQGRTLGADTKTSMLCESSRMHSPTSLNVMLLVWTSNGRRSRERGSATASVHWLTIGSHERHDAEIGIPRREHRTNRANFGQF